MSEWQLLIDSEGIEIGDKVNVEYENGNVVVMTLLKYNNKIVVLVDEDEAKHKFSAETLDTEDGYPMITGKA